MRLRRLLEAHWWRGEHAWIGLLLAPFSGVYHQLMRVRAFTYRSGLARVQRLPVPVVVVGNLVIGGAGKTPTTVALVNGLKAAGWQPGVVSRGYGSTRSDPRAVAPGDDPRACGDEPLLIRRRTASPVWVGVDRAQTARCLLAAHPEVNVIVADDGLQHLRLARDVEVVVFDERGLGNGRLLPAGPLRERPLPAPPAGTVVVYNAVQATTAWRGHAVRRRLGAPVCLAAWWRGEPAEGPPPWSGQPQPLPAAAGIAEPERFFRMLEAAGASIERLPLPDHAPWQSVPWAPGTAPVLVTEKDAVKLPPTHPDAARIHVVPLDFELPEDALAQVLSRLRQPLTPSP